MTNPTSEASLAIVRRLVGLLVAKGALSREDVLDMVKVIQEDFAKDRRALSPEAADIVQKALKDLGSK